MSLVTFFKSMGEWGDNPRLHPYLLMGVCGVFLLIFALLHHRIDYIVNLYYGIPVVLAAYFYGFWAGMAVLFAFTGLHVLMLMGMGDDYVFIFAGTRIRIAFVSLMVVGGIVSRFRALKEKLRHSEALYRSLSDELAMTNRAKDKFFSIIAHDLRGPVGSISNNLDLLLNSQHEMNESDRRQLMVALHAMSTRVFNLLENLLKWALVQQGRIHFHFVNVEMRQMTDDCFLLFQYIAREKSIELENRLPDQLFVCVDKNVMETVMRNIISNALKFTHSNGRVTVDVVPDVRHAIIRIADTGIGMTPEMVSQLFRVGQGVSTEGTHGERGSGLGLMLCDELIRQCHGRIWAESESGHGTSFFIALPKVAP
ncbi:signal transduction histidine kinase [Breznakibacter xylanolyticus]|uniref:histidine kinase n=1 Tax=Breznakibacter xylanolyticus TaxID=990 RepID=A0A2W7QED7_9BACT|nr:HAMP domain-containing sensor histidine kinase [Breznakibacter xylanolyticus]MBN2742628.1 HAMP domain-containing histidine kinase [Marinilabiliaceae bacterium]PZX20269.1 signal transduction histidine kinase [Breznakibacter xylanolyticus]